MRQLMKVVQGSADLLARHAAEPELARFAVGCGRCGALGSLHVLQVLHGPAHAKRGAVEVVLAQREGEQELVVRHQLAAPVWQISPAHSQHILQSRFPLPSGICDLKAVQAQNYDCWRIARTIGKEIA